MLPDVIKLPVAARQLPVRSGCQLVHDTKTKILHDDIATQLLLHDKFATASQDRAVTTSLRGLQKRIANVPCLSSMLVCNTCRNARTCCRGRSSEMASRIAATLLPSPPPLPPLSETPCAARVSSRACATGFLSAAFAKLATLCALPRHYVRGCLKALQSHVRSPLSLQLLHHVPVPAGDCTLTIEVG